MLLSVRKFLHIHRSGVDESRSARVPASLISQPTQVYQFESPTVANQVESESAPSSSLTSPPTTADSGPSPSSSTDTSPATLGSLAEIVKADSTPEVSPETEYNIAIEDLRNAEKILAQRHTAIKTQSKPRPAPRKSKSSPQAETFRQEEEVRRREMEVSKSSFEQVKMRGLTRWGRCKMRMRKRFGFRKGEVVGVFDPFAEY
jgi:hypothetical protein